MNELTRPNDLDFEYTKDYIRAMDSFLSACARELEEARNKREEAEGFDDDEFATNNDMEVRYDERLKMKVVKTKKQWLLAEAFQIENEVFKALRGEEK